MEKICFTIIFITLSFNYTHAQNNFLPGKVLLNNGDTLNGIINYNNRSSTYIQFKQNNDSDIKTFGVKDLKGYEIDGQYYLQKTIILDKTSYDYFLKVIVQGKASLFYLKTPGNYDHYLLEKNENIYLLKGGKKTVNRVDGTFDIEIREYWGTLRIHMADCETFKKDFPDFAYREEEMVKIVEIYNKCFGSFSKGDEIVENKSSKKVKSNIIKGLKLGINYPVISILEIKNYYNPSPTPTIGAFIDIPFSGANKNLSSYIELAYSPKASTVTKEGKSLGFSDFKINFWDLNTILRYSIAKGTVKPIIGAGVFGSISRAEISSDKEININDFVLGYLGEAGISVPFQSKNLFISSRIQKIAGIKHLTYSISVGFGF